MRLPCWNPPPARPHRPARRPTVALVPEPGCRATHTAGDFVVGVRIASRIRTASARRPRTLRIAARPIRAAGESCPSSANDFEYHCSAPSKSASANDISAHVVRSAEVVSAGNPTVCNEHERGQRNRGADDRACLYPGVVDCDPPHRGRRIRYDDHQERRSKPIASEECNHRRRIEREGGCSGDEPFVERQQERPCDAQGKKHPRRKNCDDQQGHVALHHARIDVVVRGRRMEDRASFEAKRSNVRAGSRALSATSTLHKLSSSVGRSERAIGDGASFWLLTFENAQ